MSEISADDRQRVARRYPRSRLPRPVWIVLVALGVTVAGGWLLWAAILGSHPAVTAVVSAYRVVSETRTEATITVDRSDPSKAAACRVMAQATDFQPVAEQTVRIPPADQTVVNVEVTLTTLRRATTAVVKDCSLI